MLILIAILLLISASHDADVARQLRLAREAEEEAERRHREIMERIKKNREF